MMPFKLRKLALAVAALGWLFGAPARGDTLYLKGGDKVEGEVLKDLGEAYRVRTLIGVVDIDKDRVVKRVEAPAPWRVYPDKRKACADTPTAHYKLALWCRKHGLRAEEIEQLERVIKLDPDHEEARKALGYVKEDHGWVKARRVRAPATPEDEAERAAADQERKTQKAIAQWFVKVKSIHNGRMAREKQGRASEKFRKAEEEILKIRDPLALPALTAVLSTGPIASRQVLVEALARFDEDEATMNLVIVALLDPSAEVREPAAKELARRKDPRVVGHLRDALRSDEERVLRNAAAALGILRARDAVQDLISVLMTEREGLTRISRPLFLDSVYGDYGGGVRYLRDGGLVYYRPGGFGVLGPGTIIGTLTEYEAGPIAVHRTEVQDALIAITGQNFGFNAEEWLAWWRQQKG